MTTTQQDNDLVYDVIIVGGGLTGLVAARELQRSGRSVRVLEARDFVGGRAQTVTEEFEGKKSFFDLGARFIGNHHHQQCLWQLVDELKLKRISQYDGPGKAEAGDTNYWAGFGAHLLRNGGVDIKPTPYIGPIIPNDAGGQFYLKHLKHLIDEFPIHDPRLMENAKAYDSMSVQAWVDLVNLPEVEKPPATFKALLRMLCRVGFSEEPENLSMLWFLFYIASSGGLERFQSVRWPVQGSQGYRLERGAQSIADAIHSELDTRTVVTGCKVVGIADDKESRVTVSTEDKRTFVGKKVLIAASPSLYANPEHLQFDPPLPDARMAAAAAMHTPDMILAYVTFTSAFWRDDKTTYTDGPINGEQTEGISRYGLTGDVLLTEGPVVWIMDNTSSAEQPCLLAFIVGKSARELRDDKAKRASAVIGEMCRVFGEGIVIENKPVYDEKNWSADPLTTGGPTAHFKPGGAFFEHGSEILLRGDSRPHHNVYFASSESAVISNGYMAGAVWSGQEVANDIRAALRGDGEVGEDSPMAREQAMLWCIRTILRAIAEQDPRLEFPALHPLVEFRGPGCKTLPVGPYNGLQGTFVFYKLLMLQISISKIAIESYSADVESNTGFAVFTVDGIIRANGNPFRDIKGTMAFEFDPDKSQVLVLKDWLFMDGKMIDDMVGARRGPFAEASADSAVSNAANIQGLTNLKQRAAAIARLDHREAGADQFVIVLPAGMGPTGPLVGAAGLEKVAGHFDTANREITLHGNKLDLESMTYHAWQRVGDLPLLATIRFKDSVNPVVAEVCFQIDRMR